MFSEALHGSPSLTGAHLVAARRSGSFTSAVSSRSQCPRPACHSVALGSRTWPSDPKRRKPWLCATPWDLGGQWKHGRPCLETWQWKGAESMVFRVGSHPTGDIYIFCDPTMLIGDSTTTRRLKRVDSTTLGNIWGLKRIEFSSTYLIHLFYIVVCFFACLLLILDFKVQAEVDWSFRRLAN